MRTRLDEIIEEVLKETNAVNWTFRLTEFGMECERKIAERAFRHGVDRMAKWVNDGIGCRLPVHGTHIHPAPAECLHAVRVGGVCSNLNCRDDRRKGERRGSQEMTYTPLSTGVRRYHFWIIPDGCIQGEDRRSGKDRRK